MKKNFGVFNLLLIFIVFIYFDYVSKLWAIENLFIKYQSIKLTSFLSMTPVWLIFSSFKLPRYSSLGFIFIASGAIGNAIDRIIYGKVVDFIDFHIEDLHWPAFNLADTIIFIGATLFLYNQLFTIERTYYEK